MQSLTITSNNVSATIKGLPLSKSYCNRALVYGHLSSSNFTLPSMSVSDDVKQMMRALENLDSTEVYLGEGGTTIRFLLPLLANQNHKVKVLVHPDFKSRPMEELYEALSFLGASISPGESEDHLCWIQGPLSTGASLSLDCSRSTQFASALMMIAPFIDLKLTLKKLKGSKRYLELTKKVMKDIDENSLDRVPYDYSSASYFIAYALLNQTTLFPELTRPDSFQADCVFLDLIQQIGGELGFSSNGLRVNRCSSLKTIDWDVSQCIDLTMTLVYLGIFISGQHRLKGIENLIYKESNRLQGILSTLSALEIKYSLNHNELIFEGGSPTKLELLSPMRDHRLVMMDALILKQMGGGTVSHARATHKSFPNFFKILEGQTVQIE